VATRRDSIQQLSVHAELIDIAVGRSRHIVMLFCVLFGKRNEYMVPRTWTPKGANPFALLDR
jgi:hypothetical protein